MKEQNLINKILEKINKKYLESNPERRQTAEIEMTEEKTEITDSKVAGKAYIPLGKKMPETEDGAFDSTISGVFKMNFTLKEEIENIGYDKFLEISENIFEEIKLEELKENEKKDWLICIGDVGVLNFFINSEDLKNKNFEDVLYTWDCS